MSEEVEVIEFTDPVCTWCWGSEPILKKLETVYGDQLRVKYVMGGLVKDIREFYDSYNDIGGDPVRSNQNIARHWLEASERHGMPVRSEGFELFSDDAPSTYPQNIAYKAAQMQDETLANRFLRRMREASAAEARQTNKIEVLIELASEVGLDVAKFIERLTDGTGEAAFRDDLQMVSRHGVRGFPTFLVRVGKKEALLRGYQSFDAIRSVIRALSGNSIKEAVPEKTEQKVLEFISKYGRVAPVEIQETFDYSSEGLRAVIEGLKKKNLINVHPVGNGTFIEPAGSSISCDSRVCYTK